jgi:hypothetical protein
LIVTKKQFANKSKAKYNIQNILIAFEIVGHLKNEERAQNAPSFQAFFVVRVVRHQGRCNLMFVRAMKNIVLSCVPAVAYVTSDAHLTGYFTSSHACLAGYFAPCLAVLAGNFACGLA